MSTGSFGRWGFFPIKFGGNTHPAKIIHDSLRAQLGTGYATDNENSVIYAETYAEARAISAVWSFNSMIANQGQPLKLTAFLDRVEKYLGLPVNPSLTDIDRRQRIYDLYSRRGEDIDTQFITDNMVRLMGPVFVQFEYISLANAVVHSPDASYPFGTQAPGYPWYSTVQHILILTQIPAGYSFGQYLDAVGRGNQWLDPTLPADVTWSMYLPPSVGAPINNGGAPSVGGFYLDNPHDLDFAVFAS